MNTNEFLKETRSQRRVRPRVICKDGFSISIQASETHYCTPKTNEDILFETVELGYPDDIEELILGYAENIQDPMYTVYGYVPVELVDMMLEKHGGIA